MASVPATEFIRIAATAAKRDNTTDDPRFRAPLVTRRARACTRSPTRWPAWPSARRRRAWYVAMGISLCLLGLLGLMVRYLFFTGVGVWDNNRPVCWAFDITNFVFWVGIGHAGTLISAILFLFRQNWRTSINRFAEAMTIFAVMLRRAVPRHPRRPAVAGVLAVPVSEPDGHLAEIPSARCCGTCSP